jgi:hypothetical protein
MRKLFAIVLAAVLFPAGLAAQKPVTTAPAKVTVKDMPIQQAQAQTAALAQVRAALAAGKLGAWRSRSAGGISASTLTVAGAVWRAKDAKDPASGYWFVGVTAPNAKGHVRVEIDAHTGAVVGALMIDTLGWSMSN